MIMISAQKMSVKCVVFISKSSQLYEGESNENFKSAIKFTYINILGFHLTHPRNIKLKYSAT